MNTRQKVGHFVAVLMASMVLLATVAATSVAAQEAPDEGEIHAIELEVLESEPEPWMESEADLRSVATEVIEHKDGSIEAALADGTTVRMWTGGGEGVMARSSCTKSITANAPSTYYGQARGVVSFFISSGCADDDFVTAKLRTRECGFWGCNWKTKASAQFWVYNDNVTRTVSMLACRNGSHDWRSEGTWDGLGSTISPTSYLFNNC